MAMGRKRTRDKHLPRRVYLHHGAYYFVADNKRTRLGKTYSEMLTNLAKLGCDSPLSNLGAVMDRYQLAVIPKKAESTRADQIRQLGRLRAVFGHMAPDAITPQDIYRYMDKRPAVAGNREKSLLSHVFSMAIRWGAASRNPCQLVKGNPEKARTRVVSDAEFDAVLALASDPLKIAMLVAVGTGLRLTDILRLKRAQIKDGRLTGIASKTGKPYNFRVVGRLADAVAIRLGKKITQASEYLVCNRKGDPYTMGGFSTLWQRLQARYGGTPYQFRDLRAKAATDSPTLADAQARLGHTSSATTKDIYRRKADEVDSL